MIYLKLFLSFLEIGLFTFGGGYAMISLIREKALSYNWLTEEELLNMVAISESTPGPIAVNMATFVGSAEAGILGAFLATLGVILPSFVIILIISAILPNFLKYKGVFAFLKGVRPAVIGLIIATAITTGISIIFGFQSFGDSIACDIRGLIILAIIIAIAAVFKKIKKEKPSPILMIVLSAGLCILFYSF